MALAATAASTIAPRSWPIGFGFRPTEEELITHYLTNKIRGNESDVKYIKEIDLYNYDPWQLPGKSYLKSDNYEWFFFRANTSKTRRSTPGGCWKTTGEDRPIKARGNNRGIATRKILVFYRGRGANAIKTNWVIHEYHIHPDIYTTPYHKNQNDSRRQPPFVVCRLKENAEERHCDQDECNNTSPLAASHLKNKRKMNQDTQASEQPTARPNFRSTSPLNMQPIQPGASENITEFLNSTLLPDECLDDATSNMYRPSSSSVPEPDFQSSNENDGEVANQLWLAQALEHKDNLYEHLYSMLSDDENCANDRIDSYNKEELDEMVLELQCYTDTSDTTFVLPNNLSTSSAGQNISTVKKLHRSPLASKHLKFKEEQYVLQRRSSVHASEGEAQAVVSYKSEPKIGMSRCRSTGSTNNCFWYILTTKRIRHNSSLPLVYAAKALLGILMFVGFAQEMLLYGHRR